MPSPLMNIFPKPNQNKRQNGSADILPVISVAGLVLLYGLVISLYTVLLRRATFQANGEDSIKQAALFLAREMSYIAVDDPVFGKVGLVDAEPSDSNPNRITSLNRIYATIRLDNAIAKELKLPLLETLAKADFQRAENIESRLRTTLAAKIDPTSKDKQREYGTNLYRAAYKMVTGAARSDETLVDLRIKLGTLKPVQFPTQVPSISGCADSADSINGQYKPGVSLDCAGGTVRLYQLAPEPRLCETELFDQTDTKIMPSSVLVEATYKTSQKTDKIDIIKSRMSCAIAGGTPAKSTPSVLMISFPHGMPPTLTSLRALIKSAGSSGEWQQVTGGEVPGAGHLSAPIGLDTDAAPAGEATQLAIYHWLRSLGTNARVDKAAALLDVSWAQLHPDKRTQPQDVVCKGPNSALTKDTGARAFSLLYQSGPGGAGQSALKAAFEANIDNPAFPHSAVPLQIDANGTCNLCGVSGFDQTVVQDFLQSIYDTNLAAIESAALAKSITRRLERATEQVENSLQLTIEELNSVKGRLDRERTSPKANDDRENELQSLEKSKQELERTMAAQQTKIKNYRDAMSRAATVIANAEEAGESTYELTAHMDRYANEGILATNGHQAFLLSNNTVFTPLRKPATEEQIYHQMEDELYSSKTWVSKTFGIFDRLNTTADELKRAAKPIAKPAARFIVLDSGLLTGENGKVTALTRTPFGNSGIPVDQLSYYAQDAVTTGASPAVGWSMLIRDVVANKSKTSKPVSADQPKLLTNEDLPFSTCPTLSVEIQVRSPVPMPDKLPAGSAVVNPITHERASQVPPMPAGML